MRRSFLPGMVAGGLLAGALGYAAAVLPASPTWALWEIKRAVDRRDLDALQGMVDVPAVVGRALGDLARGDAREPTLDLGSLGLSLLRGDRLLTVFDDPDRPLRIGAADIADAWWHMHTEEGLTTLTLDLGGRDVSLLLRRGDGRWRIVGVTPLTALLRLKPATGRAGR